MPGIQDYTRIEPLDEEIVMQPDSLAELCQRVYVVAGVP